LNTTVKISALEEQIRAKCQESGAITFDSFMQSALYAKELGYYNNPANTIFGSNGDFLTAPHISEIFSICIARQCREIMTNVASNTILEIGAGTGTMAAAILTWFRQQGQKISYYIYETSANLRARQHAMLDQHANFHSIHWLDSLDNFSFKGVAIANEVLDALPVKIFRLVDSKLQELGVCFTDSPEPTWLPPSSKLLDEWRQLGITISSPYTSEINTNIKPWLQSVGNSLNQGVILVCDYGYPRSEYYHPDRSMGTFTCFHKHEKNYSPFLRIGKQDLTAHIDFSAVANKAIELGLAVLNYTQQAAFLLSTGITDLVEQQMQTRTLPEQIDINNQARKLCSPTEMGEIIKMIALGKNYEHENLLGFNLSCHKHRL